MLLDCPPRIKRERESGRCRPLESGPAYQHVKALAPPFGLRPAWQDIAHP
ncbi:hypothetical protein ABZX77_50050 [Streptomyces sp. NPDC004237]